MRATLQADVVMTDDFFPAAPGEPVGPNGAIMMEHCHSQKKRVVWIAPKHLYGTATIPMSKWEREHELDPFGDDHVGPAGESLHKPWRAAFIAIMALAIGMHVDPFDSLRRDRGAE